MAFDRMNPEQLARAKGSHANELRRLAIAANGLGVSRVDKEKAQAEMERTVGAGKAKRMKEDALQSAGARPKGVIGWLLS